MAQTYKTQLIIALLCLSLLLCAGCSETFKALTDLARLRNDLMKQYNERDINVTVQNSHVLGISFINSSFNKLGEAEREEKAREIALFAKDHYAAMSAIDTIWVSFVDAKNYIVFHYSTIIGSYVFNKNGLAPSNNNGGRSVLSSSFDPSRNQTTVYLSQNLQVYSERDGGIMLFPHFVVSGNDASAPKLAKPKVVSLDFSSNSAKRMFPNNPKLVIYVDDEPLFSGTARTTNVMGSDAEKSFNEFLTQDISYDQFTRLADARSAKFILGTKEFELKPSHIGALRAMRSCIEELKCE